MPFARPSYGFSHYSRVQSPLTLAQVERAAPAIFSNTAVETVSERYQFIPSNQVFEVITESGYLPVHVQTKRTRGEVKHASHMVVFQHRDTFQGGLSSLRAVGDSIQQLRFMNGHDGKTGYRMIAQTLRLVCLNGMTTTDGDNGFVNIRHSGKNVLDKVADGIVKINAYLPEAEGIWRGMQMIELAKDEQEALTIGAIIARWGKANHDELLLPDGTALSLRGMPKAEAATDVTNSMEDGEDEDEEEVGPLRAPVTIAQMLAPRRNADVANDLSTVANRIQENVLFPTGQGTYINDVNGRRNYRKVAPVSNVNKDLNINRAIWAMSQYLRQSRNLIEV